LQQFVRRPAGVLGDLGAADLHQQLDAAAGRIDQAHQRHAQLVRQALDVDPLVGDGGFGRLPARMVKSSTCSATLRPSMRAGADDGVGGVDALVAPSRL
jgi:hypothetical protein